MGRAVNKDAEKTYLYRTYSVTSGRFFPSRTTKKLRLFPMKLYYNVCNMFSKMKSNDQALIKSNPLGGSGAAGGGGALNIKLGRWRGAKELWSFVINTNTL